MIGRQAAIGIGIVLAGACSAPPPAAPAAEVAAVPLYDNLGDHQHAVSTSSAEAQKYFNQGLTLSYAFNHAEAIRAFRHAATLDPDCAMCYWGVAFALGPNINAPITAEAAKEAYDAIQQARARAGRATDKERAYIEALAHRYVADPAAERAPLDARYAAAMRDVAARFPDDLDAATLYAQALMDTAPWNYWDKDGNPRPFTPDVLAALESVLARHPKHPGAIHLYIHAVEASRDPGRASAYADALPALVPGAGHLVHMPAHIYLRTGRYNDASVANQRALQADETYFAGNPVAGNMMYQVGYLPHNIHFFVASASMEGRRADALKAAADVRGRMHGDMLRDPGMGGMVQHMQLTPLFTMLRFGLWEQVLAEPLPPADLPYMRAIVHAARGLAFAATGKLTEAERERVEVAAVKDDASLPTLFISSVNNGAQIAAIAHEVLAGDIETRKRRADAAARHFTNAVAMEDALIYMEPPDWPIPVRQLQGAALLDLGRTAEAERAFREDMVKFPDNGWSLSGLRTALERRGKAADAAEVGKRLERQWSRADIKVAGGRPIS